MSPRRAAARKPARKVKPPCPVRREADRITAVLRETYVAEGCWDEDRLAEALARELRIGGTLTALLATIPGRHV